MTPEPDGASGVDPDDACPDPEDLVPGDPVAAGDGRSAGAVAPLGSVSFIPGRMRLVTVSRFADSNAPSVTRCRVAIPKSVSPLRTV